MSDVPALVLRAAALTNVLASVSAYEAADAEEILREALEKLSACRAPRAKRSTPSCTGLGDRARSVLEVIATHGPIAATSVKDMISQDVDERARLASTLVNLRESGRIQRNAAGEYYVTESKAAE